MLRLRPMEFVEDATSLAFFHRALTIRAKHNTAPDCLPAHAPKKSHRSVISPFLITSRRRCGLTCSMGARQSDSVRRVLSAFQSGTQAKLRPGKHIVYVKI